MEIMNIMHPLFLAVFISSSLRGSFILSDVVDNITLSEIAERESVEGNAGNCGSKLLEEGEYMERIDGCIMRSIIVLFNNIELLYLYLEEI